jgi:uncharacterized coiled-coil DUF342 family protein
MLDRIKEDINKRMSEYKDSRHPTNDEVSIAWLVSEVERLEKALADEVAMRFTNY